MRGGTHEITQKVFVSSTYEDMKEYRSAADTALRSTGKLAVVMEDFAANPEPPIEVCRQKVKECDALVLILGFKYGSTIPDGRSYSELEYDTAVKAGMPVFVYMLDDGTRVPANMVDTGNSRDKLDSFKDRLKAKHTVVFFNNAQDLQRDIERSVTQELTRISESSGPRILEGKEAVDAFKKFNLMPVRYNGIEAILDMVVLGGFSGWRVKSSLIESLGMRVGDCVQVEVGLENQDIYNVLDDPTIDLFADSDDAQWLVDNVTGRGTVVTAHVRFVSSVVKGITEDPEAEVTKPSLVLMRGIASTQPRHRMG